MIVLTDCISVEDMTGEVKILVVEDCEIKQSVACGAEESTVFPFGLREMDGEVYFADYSKHYIYKVTFSRRSYFGFGKRG